MSEENETTKGALPKFDGKDFPVWKMKIECYFISKGQDHLLSKGRPRILTSYTEEEKKMKLKEQTEYDKLDKIVKSTLLLALENKQARLVLQLALYEHKSEVSRVSLQKEFFDMRMKYKETVQDNIARGEYIYNQLFYAGVKMTEQDLTGKLVSGLSRRYLNFMSSWSNIESGKQTVEFLIQKLGAEESLINSFQKLREENAYNSQETNNKRFNNNKNRNYRQKGKFNKNHNNKNQNSDQPKGCYYCHEVGHIKKECPKLNKKKGQKKDDSTQEKTVKGDNNDKDLSYICEATMNTE